MSSSPSAAPERTPKEAIARPRRWWLWRLLRALVLAAVILAAGLAAASLVIERMARIEPPPVSPAVRNFAQHLALKIEGDRRSLGVDEWMTRRRGVWELHLAGDPYTLGWAHGRLGARFLVEQEDYMFAEFHRYVPSRIAQTLIRAGVMLRYRHLGRLLPPDRQLELAGVANGSPDLWSSFLPIYHRMVFYHALHDITQTIEHSPLLGCTAFAASGKATRDGHLVIGRNFDFEGPEIFDREKVVLFFKPTGKIPFASVAWTGMTGAVTGVNAEKIYVSVNAARTDDPGQSGIPVEILIREILENARSIDDVVARVRAPVLVPDLYLVGDGKTGEAVVIERSPTRLEVRRLSRETGWIGLTNHARSPAFASDIRNDHLKRYLTSDARLQRLEELLRARAGSISPQSALEILRDKKGVGDKPLALGNRNALDALIATHSVVLDATDMVLWVGAGPHASGRYVAFDLERELLGAERPAAVDLPPDPVLESRALTAHLQSLAVLRVAERLRERGLDDAAIEQARASIASEETSADAHLLLGNLLWRRRSIDEARAEYRRFLALDPPYLSDIEAARARLR